MTISERSGRIAQRLAIRVSLEGPSFELVNEHNAAVNRNRAALDASLAHEQLNLDDIVKLTAAKILKYRDERQSLTFDLLRNRCQFAAACAGLLDAVEKDLQAREIEGQKAFDDAWQKGLKGLAAIGITADSAGEESLARQIQSVPAVRETKAALEQTSNGISVVLSQRQQLPEVQQEVDEDLMAFVRGLIE